MLESPLDKIEPYSLFKATLLSKFCFLTWPSFLQTLPLTYEQNYKVISLNCTSLLRDTLLSRIKPSSGMWLLAPRL